MNCPLLFREYCVLPAILLTALSFFISGCSGSQPRSVEQDGIKEMKPSDMLKNERRATPPGPPPFSEKMAPVTSGVIRSPKLLSMVFEDALLSEVLRALSGDMGLNLIVDSEIDLNRQVTLSLNNVTFAEALEMAVSKGAGYAWKMEGSNLYIQRFEERVYHLDYLDLSGETEIDVGGDMLASSVEESGVSGKFELKTKRSSKLTDVWSNVQESLEGLKSAEGVLQINRNSGIIYMVDTPRKVAGMVKFLDSLSDSLHRQVFIEARIMEVQLNDGAKYGIDWSKLNLNFRSATSRLPDVLNLNLNSGAVSKSGGAVLLALPEDESGLSGRQTRYDQPGISSVSAVIDFLRTQGDLSVLSNPHLTVMNGQSSLMTVGFQFPYGDVDGVDRDVETGVTTIGVEIRRVVLGLQLGITPQISKNGIITLNIVPTITRIQREENVELPLSATTIQTISNPVIDLQGMATTVRVRDGESIVLAGLISQVRSNNREGLPFLGDLPYIGSLFQHIEDTMESRELVIFITPHLRHVKVGR